MANMNNVKPSNEEDALKKFREKQALHPPQLLCHHTTYQLATFDQLSIMPVI